MILTPDDIKSRSLDKTQPDWTSTNTVSEFDASYKDIAENIISEIEHEIETHLDRQLSISKRQIFIDSWQPESDGTFIAYARHFPIVQIETSNVTMISDFEVSASSKLDKIEAFTGYKHHSQMLADLQNEYPDLQTEPDNYPSDIQRVALNLVMFDIRQRMDGMYGQASKTMNTGQANITVQRQDTQFVERQLQKLNKYRWLT